MGRFLTGFFGAVGAIVTIYAAANYGFKTSDSDTDGYFWALVYGFVSAFGVSGFAIGFTLWRHHRLAGACFVLISALALTASLTNQLGAMAGRGSAKQSKVLKDAESSRSIKRNIDRAEGELNRLQFVPTDAGLVQTAGEKLATATARKAAECTTRGERCRVRESEENDAITALADTKKQKLATDRAKELRLEIADLQGQLKRAGPEQDSNPQGSFFARILHMPETEADRLSAYQNLAMAAIIELITLISWIGFEILSHAKLKADMALAAATKPAEATKAEPEERNAVLAPPKPRLITSEPVPFGSVRSILPNLMESGEGNLREKDAFVAYAQQCRAQGKQPVPPEKFVSDLKKLCKAADIAIDATGKHVYLLKVRLKNSGEMRGNHGEGRLTP